MIDHVSVGVRDLERAARFYEPTLAALGLNRLVTRPATIGFGKAYPEFWINLRATMAHVAHESGTHICLRAKTTTEVDAFHAAARSRSRTPTETWSIMCRSPSSLRTRRSNPSRR
ncbi:MAG: VOC family protein, partial [Bradyrhizobium sp.]